MDATLLAWGIDFIREEGAWTNRLAKRYQAPALIRDSLQLRRNAYRVLLTRARDATVVFVPPLPILDETFQLSGRRWFPEPRDQTLAHLAPGGNSAADRGTLTRVLRKRDHPEQPLPGRLPEPALDRWIATSSRFGQFGS